MNASGVHRRYMGSAGKITNCQIGVFAAYVSGKGHALVDRALYLPKTWSGDSARRAATHVPEDVTFAAMIGRADHPLPLGIGTATAVPKGPSSHGR